MRCWRPGPRISAAPRQSKMSMPPRWRKGAEHLAGQEHLALVDAMMLAWTGRTTEGDSTFAGPIGTVTGQAEFYRPLLDAIREAPTTIGQLRTLPAVRERAPGEFIQA